MLSEFDLISGTVIPKAAQAISNLIIFPKSDPAMNRKQSK